MNKYLTAHLFALKMEQLEVLFEQTRSRRLWGKLGYITLEIVPQFQSGDKMVSGVPKIPGVFLSYLGHSIQWGGNVKSQRFGHFTPTYDYSFTTTILVARPSLSLQIETPSRKKSRATSKPGNRACGLFALKGAAISGRVCWFSNCLGSSRWLPIGRWGKFDSIQKSENPVCPANWVLLWPFIDALRRFFFSKGCLFGWSAPPRKSLFDPLLIHRPHKGETQFGAKNIPSAALYLSMHKWTILSDGPLMARSSNDVWMEIDFNLSIFLTNRAFNPLSRSILILTCLQQSILA